MMDKVLKKTWVAALRSGEYAQCQKRLKNQNPYIARWIERSKLL